MNFSNIQHGVIALCLQVIVGLVTGNWLFGVFLATGLFFGREHAQFQRHIADDTGRTVKQLEWWEGCDISKWSTDSKLDFIVPVLVTIAAFFIAGFITG